MSGLVDTRSRLDLVNLEYHQSVAEHHPNLVMKFSFFKDMDDVYPFHVRVVDRRK